MELKHAVDVEDGVALLPKPHAVVAEAAFVHEAGQEARVADGASGCAGA